MIIEAKNYRGFLYLGLQMLFEHGQVTSPRNMETLEIENAIIKIYNPKDRLAILPGLKS